MDNTTIQQIKDSIASASNIGIATGPNPSMDEMAGALSLYLLLDKANKNVSIASPSDPLVEIASLVGIDKVKRSIGGTAGGDLTVSFPYTEGEIEKVSYTLEDGQLNIIVKAAEQGLSFDEQDVKYIRGGGSVDLLIVVGAAKLADIGQVVDVQNQDMKIINIDNKAENEQYGDIVLVSERLSSISEGVADLALALGFNVDQDSAQNLLSGITSATNNFQDSKTSSLAFEMSGFLIKKGAVRESSASARRGINFGESAQRDSQPKRQAAAPRPNDQRRSEEKRDEDRRKFEETLQNRVREEKAKEAGRTDQGNRKQQNEDDSPSDDNAPVDWLAPKVYKGSSEV